ncbi:microviridin/marinostatin family tricyclic proteinase inhibitor [Nannocystaceae bacterium ST9]
MHRNETTMANKTTDQQNQETGGTPFFAHLLSSQRDPAAAPGGGPAPTYHCLDQPCTKKYPSDDDESTTWFNDADG